MNRRDRIRRQWTHRRLGLGSTQATDLEMLRTESLLTAVGARRTSTAGFSADGFDAALFDFVCDIDLTAGVPAVDSVPIPLAELRAALPAPRRSRLTWRVLIPVATSGVAAIAIAITALVAGSSTPPSPALTATAESRQLLSHADTLLDAATHAGSADRAKLVTEAKADLSHVSRLLPLAAPETRSELRGRMTALDQRARPLSAKSSRPTAASNDDPSGGGTSFGGSSASQGSGESTGSGTGSGEGSNLGTPLRRRPVRRPPATGTGEGAGSTTPSSGGGPTSGEPTTTQPTQRPQPTSGPEQAPSNPTQSGTAQTGTTEGTAQQPPPGGAPRPRP